MINKYIYFLLLTSISTLIYPLKQGSQLWHSGFNGGIAGQGFGGIASKNSGFYSLINPASGATTDNIRFFSSGNIIDTNWGGSFGISAPIDTGGVLFAGSQHLSLDETTTTHIGYGKKVLSDLALGFDGIISIHPNNIKNNVGGGFSFGILWLPKDFVPIKNGWGFVDFSLGGVVRTVFYPTSGTCFNNIPSMIFQIGIEATIMKFQHTSWKFLIDYSLGFVPLRYPNTAHFQTWTSLGTTWTFWNIWDISVGTILGNHGLGFGNNKVSPFTVGTGLGYTWPQASFKISYAFGGHEFFDKQEYLHTVSLELGIGSPKSTNMKAILTSVNHENLTNYFSPNNDLIKDNIIFLPKVVGKIPVTSWRLTIQNPKGDVIKTFEPVKKKSDDLSTSSKAFYNYFVPTKSNDIPDKIIWDGTDHNNKIMPEGTYLASLYIKYNENEFAISDTNTIIIDTTAPTADISVTEKDRFLFLGDNPESVLYITQNLSSQDPWSAKLIDNIDNKVIEDWIWKVGNSPQTNTWKLRNPKRMNVASGTFSYIVTSYDKAGNFTEKKITNITIETQKRNAKISSTNTSFSPNNDNILDNIDINIEYTVTNGLTKSCLTVYNNNNKKMYTYSQNTSKLLNSLQWNGKNNNSVLDDDQYLVVLEQHYIDGKQINSNPIIITIDTTPPIFNTVFSPKRFSPDNDGMDDVLKIDFSAEDIHNISNWTISIKNENNDTLETFSGTKNKSMLFWHPPVNTVKSTEKLFFDITISDILGNKISAPFHEIRLDILTDPTDKNLIITEASAYFEPGVGVISGSVFPFLDHIWQYYQYYPNDHIQISAQAYYTEANNSKTEAYKLGITRGEAIKAYLMNKGIHENKIDIKVEIYDEKNTKKQQYLRKAKVYLKRSVIK